MTDFPPLTETEVQAEKARHVPVDSKYHAGVGWHQVCFQDQQPWPCPTIRLIAERERLLGALAHHEAEHQRGRDFLREYEAALAETGEKDA